MGDTTFKIIVFFYIIKSLIKLWQNISSVAKLCGLNYSQLFRRHPLDEILFWRSFYFYTFLNLNEILGLLFCLEEVFSTSLCFVSEATCCHRKRRRTNSPIKHFANSQQKFMKSNLFIYFLSWSVLFFASIN